MSYAAAILDESHPLYRDTPRAETPAKSIADRAAFVCEMLWQFGPPSGLACDQDSERFVAHGLNASVPPLTDAIGADAAKRDEAKALIRAFVSARSSHPFDKGQADRICRAIHRAWMCAIIAKHPRAGRFGTLTDALRRGRFTEAQMNLAKKLVAEVGA